jgi:hypothetical protein
MSDFKTGNAPSTSVGEAGFITQQSTIQKQTVGNSFSEKLAQFGGNVASQLGNGVATVSGAIGFVAGRSAGAGLANLGANLAQFGTTNPAQISTQVHGLSNSQAANGGAAVATGPGVVAQPAFGAGTSGPAAGGPGEMKSAAFGSGAIGLDTGISMGGTTGGLMGSGSAGSAGTSGTMTAGMNTGGDSSNALLSATKQMQETQMSFNLQYLQLQNQMQNENRSYTCMSNIMKTKHDTCKNSISNVR